MAALHIRQDQLTPELIVKLQALCPFGALVMENGQLQITAACKMCRLCVKNDASGTIEYLEGPKAEQEIDKAEWNGVAVYAQQENGALSPVVFELLGKAMELAHVIHHPVYAILIGHQVHEQAEALLAYGAEVVYVYDAKELEHFRVLPYAAVFEDFVHKVKPCSILVGATNVGRSLAPRVAARFGTGLTADCTRLEMKKNTDLVQIRPAFGGNIMAQIITPKHRPQFCTVRYKVFSAPCQSAPHGRIVSMDMEPEKLKCNTTVLESRVKKADNDISEADVLVVVGRGIKSEKDLQMAKQLADALGAQMACTRPLVENGWFGAKKQVGLSGRTVAPKVLVALGISGAVQFTAGIQNAGTVIAVNSDADAPIFDVAHYGLVGDLYEIVPRLLAQIEKKEVCINV